MNYTKIYNNLMSSRKVLNRKKITGDGHEKHHIIPRCLNGTNDKENIVVLTFREHFLAHKILVKLYDGEMKKKMQQAWWRMTNKSKTHGDNRILTSRQYEEARAAFIESVRGKKLPAKTREKMSESARGENNGFFGKHHSKKNKKKWSQQRAGNGNPMFGKRYTDEEKEKSRIAHLNQKHSKESIEKMKIAKGGINNPMHGTFAYLKWIEKYGEEEANMRREECKLKKQETWKKKREAKLLLQN